MYKKATALIHTQIPSECSISLETHCKMEFTSVSVVALRPRYITSDKPSTIPPASDLLTTSTSTTHVCMCMYVCVCAQLENISFPLNFRQQPQWQLYKELWVLWRSPLLCTHTHTHISPSATQLPCKVHRHIDVTCCYRLLCSLSSRNEYHLYFPFSLTDVR